MIPLTHCKHGGNNELTRWEEAGNLIRAWGPLRDVQTRYKPLHRDVRYAFAIKKEEKRGAWNVVARQSLSWATFCPVDHLFLQTLQDQMGLFARVNSTGIRIDLALHKFIVRNRSKMTDYTSSMNVRVNHVSFNRANKLFAVLIRDRASSVLERPTNLFASVFSC